MHDTGCREGTPCCHPRVGKAAAVPPRRSAVLRQWEWSKPAHGGKQLVGSEAKTGKPKSTKFVLLSSL